MEVKLSKVFGAALEGDLSVGERSALAAVMSTGGGGAAMTPGSQDASEESQKMKEIWRDLQ
jgi:hypothetical protein